MTLRWGAFDAVGDGTGCPFLTELVSLEFAWPARRIIGAASTGQATLYLNGIPALTKAGLPDFTKPPTTDAAPKDWENLVEPDANLLACWDDTDPAQTPQWVGLIWRQDRQTSTDTVTVTMNTAESYLARRDVGDYDGSGKGQNVIIAALVEQFAASDGGLPFTVRTVTPGDGKIRTNRKYATTEFTSVYQRLQELSSGSGGPEFTVEWSWDATRTKLIPELLVGDRIGTAAAGGVPVAVFDMPGCLRDLTMTLDYSEGKGANVVTAYSSGAGKSIPNSGPVSGPRGRKLRVDLARQFEASRIDKAELLDHAQNVVAQLAPGAQSVAMVGDLAASPRLGQDWRLGDDIGYHVDKTVRAFPRGLDGVARALAVDIGKDTISPLFSAGSEVT